MPAGIDKYGRSRVKILFSGRERYTRGVVGVYVHVRVRVRTAAEFVTGFVRSAASVQARPTERALAVSRKNKYRIDLLIQII